MRMFPNKYLGRQGRERKNNDWFPDSSLNLNNTGHTSCCLIHKQHKYTRVNIYLVIYTESLLMLAFIVNHTKMAYYHYIVIALLHCPTNTYLRNELTKAGVCQGPEESQGHCQALCLATPQSEDNARKTFHPIV